MRIVLMGPPGAGKGTQAVRIAARHAIPAISTGDIFRSNVAAGTELGAEAQRYMAAGEYVPDSLTNAMVAARISEPDATDGFLLDGYPRTVDQVAALDAMLAAAGTPLDAVIELTVDTDEVVTRLAARAAEQGRADDTEAVIRRRLEVYAEQTAPLVAIYSERGLLIGVDGMGTIDEVTERLAAALPAEQRS